MKLQGRAARDWLRRPTGAARLVLLSGADPVRVDRARARVLDAWVGPTAAAEMRLDRLSAAGLRQDAARLVDAVKAIGFFGGDRAVWVEDATDGLAPIVAGALDAWADGDARIVVTAAALTARGALRTLADARPDTLSIALYDDPPTAAEVAADVAEAGLRPDDAARAALARWAQDLPAGDWATFLERLALHELGSTGSLTVTTVEALAPQALDADVGDVVAAIGRRDPAAVAIALRRALAQKVSPVTIVLAVTRAARTTHAQGSAGGTHRSYVNPTGFGDTWTSDQVDEALRRLVALDLTLRSSPSAPLDALLERELMGLMRA